MPPPAYSRKAWDISALIAAIFGDYGGFAQYPHAAQKAGRLPKKAGAAVSGARQWPKWLRLKIWAAFLALAFIVGAVVSPAHDRVSEDVLGIGIDGQAQSLVIRTFSTDPRVRGIRQRPAPVRPSGNACHVTIDKCH
jgi:hypothetical protein